MTALNHDTSTHTPSHDTAGFAFEPYRLELDRTTGERVQRANTLQYIAEEMLSQAITWLLGYDARYPLDEQIRDRKEREQRIRTQHEGSHWLTASCLALFLTVRKTLRERHPLLVSEIEDRVSATDLNRNPLAWLVDPGSYIDAGQGEVRWYGKEYDTASVAQALLQVRRTPDLSLPDTVRRRLDDTLTGALRWLYRDLTFSTSPQFIPGKDEESALERSAVDEEAFEVFEPLIRALADPTFDMAKVLGSSSAVATLYEYLDQWLSRLKAQIDAPGKEPAVMLKSNAVSDSLTALIEAYVGANESVKSELLPYARRSRDILEHVTEHLVTALEQDQWSGDSMGRVLRLQTYLAACYSAAQNLSPQEKQRPNGARSEIIVQMLSAIKSGFFTNGSLYHSVHATYNFAHMLMSMLEWPGCDRLIMWFYQDALYKAAFGETAELHENFELRRQLNEMDEELYTRDLQRKDLIKHEQKVRSDLIGREQKVRYLLLLVLWLMLVSSCIVVALPYLDVGNLIGFSGLIAGVTAIVLVVLERFVFSEETLERGPVDEARIQRAGRGKRRRDK